MHRDHNIFVEAIRTKKKVKLTFCRSRNNDVGDGLFGPIFYSAAIAVEDSDCYYLWDFEAGIGNNFLGLPPSQVVKMELTNESFDFVKFFTSRNVIGDSEFEDGLNFPKAEVK